MKKNKFLMSLLSIICIVFALVGCGNNKQSNTVTNNKSFEERLFALRTNYIGDASKSSMIAQNLNLGDNFEYYATSLQTDSQKPLGINIMYKSLDGSDSLTTALKYKFLYNSFIVFSLIENCDVVTISVDKEGTVFPLDSIQRQTVVDLLGYDPFTKTATQDELKTFLAELEKVDYSTVKLPSSNLDDAINNAIVANNKGKFYGGEFATASHILLSTETDDQNTIANVYMKYHEFQFENGIFEVCSGAVHPAKIIFTKDIYSNYTMINYQNPDDGSLYKVSLQKMFSDEDLVKIDEIEANETMKQELDDKIVGSVKDYLTYIGRSDATIALTYQEKNYPPLETKNAILYDILYKAYSEYPYYVGSIERIEEGTRYEYKTEYEKSGTSDIFTYTKTNVADKSVLEKTKIEITGSEVKALEGEIRKDYFDFKTQYDKDVQASAGYQN